jgi:hypothetical protein
VAIKKIKVNRLNSISKRPVLKVKEVYFTAIDGNG